VAERVAIEGLTGLSDDQAYRAMDFLLDALPEIASEVFDSVAHLLNLDLDIAFVVIRLIGGLLRVGRLARVPQLAARLDTEMGG